MAHRTLIIAKVAAAAALTVSLTACDSININLPKDGVTVDVSQGDSQPAPDGAPGKAKPTAGQPQPAPDKSKPADDSPNIIDVGDSLAYFEDSVTETHCIIQKSSVYCNTDSLEQLGKKLDSREICGDTEDMLTVDDVAIADGKSWYGCTNEPIWGLFVLGSEDDYDALVDWVIADKTGQHKIPADREARLIPPVLLPNTTLVAGDHSCTATSKGLDCQNTVTGASFSLTKDQVTTTKESTEYPMPEGIL